MTHHANRLPHFTRAAMIAFVGYTAALALYGIAVVLSWHGIVAGARKLPTIGDPACYGVAALADGLAATGAIMAAGFELRGRSGRDWRLIAYAGIAAALALNVWAGTAAGWDGWIVYAISPATTAVITHRLSVDATRAWDAHTPRVRPGRVPLRLWVTAPVESTRTVWWMTRTGETDPTAARAATDRCDFALALLRDQDIPWRVRRLITRKVWSRGLDPAALADLINTRDGELVRAVLNLGACHATTPAPVMPLAVEAPPAEVVIDPAPVAPRVSLVAAARHATPTVTAPLRHDDNATEDATSPDKDTTRRAIVHANPDATLAELAELMGCSPRTASRIKGHATKGAMA